MKRYMILSAVIVSLLFTACSGKNVDADSAAETEINLEEGQSLMIGQVTAINGNEVVLALAKEADMQGNGRGEMPSLAEGEMPSFAGGEMPDFTGEEMPSFAGGEVPDFAEGEMPSFAEGEMPDFAGGEMPGFAEGEDPDGDAQDGGGGRQRYGGGMQDQGQERVFYQLTGEEKTLLIPVGTAVTTPLGTQTTFSSIAVEDMLKLVVEEDADGRETVTAIWIVE